MRTGAGETALELALSEQYACAQAELDVMSRHYTESNAEISRLRRLLETEQGLVAYLRTELETYKRDASYMRGQVAACNKEVAHHREEAKKGPFGKHGMGVDRRFAYLTELAEKTFAHLEGLRVDRRFGHIVEMVESGLGQLGRIERMQASSGAGGAALRTEDNLDVSCAQPEGRAVPTCDYDTPEEDAGVKSEAVEAAWVKSEATGEKSEAVAATEEKSEAVEAAGEKSEGVSATPSPVPAAKGTVQFCGASAATEGPCMLAHQKRVRESTSKEAVIRNISRRTGRDVDAGLGEGGHSGAQSAHGGPAMVRNEHDDLSFTTTGKKKAEGAQETP